MAEPWPPRSKEFRLTRPRHNQGWRPWDGPFMRTSSTWLSTPAWWRRPFMATHIIKTTYWKPSAVAARLSIMTTMVGWTFFLSAERLWPVTAGHLQPLVSEQPRWQVHRCHGKGGLRYTGWSSGVCVGDYNNDGFEDLLFPARARTVLPQQR